MSFCVPIYNNAQAAYELAQDLLKAKETNFEVIVSDDASLDNSQQLLSQIQDPRFKYFRNKKKLGALKNWEHSLELGRGEWLYLVMGRDVMRGCKIPTLIKFLNEANLNNITLFYDTYEEDYVNKTKIYSGFEAVTNFIGCYHPTGTIFNAKLFNEIPNRHRYFEISDTYPENYVKRDLLLKGNGAFIYTGINTTGRYIDMAKVKSNFGIGTNGNVYYSPKRRFIQCCEWIDMVDELSGTFTSKQLDRNFRKFFYWLLLAVSIVWHNLCKSYVHQAHYGQQVRHVGISEMLGNIKDAHVKMKLHLREKNTYSLRRELIMYFCLAKFFIYFPVKEAVKKILQPLGIWHILRSIVKSCYN